MYMYISRQKFTPTAIKRGFPNTEKSQQRVAEAVKLESTGPPQKKSKIKERYAAIISPYRTL